MPAYPGLPQATPADLPSIPAGLPPVQGLPTRAATAEGPRAFSAPTPAQPSAAAASLPAPAEPEARRQAPADSGPAVVAASGNKVWIRLDERRTISLQAGQSLEGYGALLGVSRGVAKFERGTITSKSE